MSRILQRAWQRRGAIAWLLSPLALLLLLVSTARRFLYRRGVLHAQRLPVPVIVVGNIAVGGTGKTPTCLWLADFLRRRGRRPGIISRGYGSKEAAAREVGPDDSAEAVGDEPLLLRRRSGCPTFVGHDRVAVGWALLARHPECDIIISDDGMQHYRLQRDIELALVDGRGVGNGWVLPAGPLRELPRRLREVDAVICNGEVDAALPARRRFRLRLEGERFYRADAPELTCSPGDLAGRRLHACAGIGVPQRFFDHLLAMGLGFVPHAFPDHHRYRAADLAFADCDALLMTEKDAIKCAGLAPCPIWVLPVTAVMEPGLAAYLLEKLDGPAPAGNPGLPPVQGTA